MSEYRRVLANGLVVASARPEHAAALEQLQRVVFPTLTDKERFKAAHYRKHLESWKSRHPLIGDVRGRLDDVD